MFKPLSKDQYDKAIQSGFSSQQIVEMEKKRKEQNTEQPQGYLSRVWNEYMKAGKGIVSGVEKGAAQVEEGGLGNVAGGLARGALRTVGGVAEATFAPITEAPGIKQGLELLGENIAKIPGVESIVQKATELADKYPEYAKDFKNIIDIATLGGGKVAEKPVGAVLEKTGVGLEKTGGEAIISTKESFARELVKPFETKATKLAAVKRTTESGGLFKKDVVIPTAIEERAAKEVSQIPGVASKNTFQKNFNVVRDFNVNQAKQLEADITKYNFPITKEEMVSTLNTAAEELKKSPLIVGDASKTAQKLIAGAKKIINENSADGAGLLRARKQYDAWVLSQKPKVFDASSENAFTTSNDAIRRAMNDLLDEKAINLGVKDSLKKQSLLYTAMENIAPKAAEEANTVFGRTMQRIGKALGTKNKIVQGLAALAGIGGLGAAATFAPAAAVLGGTGLVFYKAGKLVMSPEVRIAIGKLLQTSGKLLNPEDKKFLEEALRTYKSE